jgi:hypothetical protein
MMTKLDDYNAKAPTHGVFLVTKRKGTRNPDWVKVGVAWEHKDEDGVNLALNNLGQTVHLIVRRIRPKLQTETEA